MHLDSLIQLLQRRRTKIIATIGPASSSPDVLDALITAGVDIFRLNMSHGSHEGHRDVFEKIRTAASIRSVPVGILADLCGPKIRVGEIAGGEMELQTGSTVVVTTEQVIGQAGVIPSQYVELADDVRQGDRILLDDGNLELEVTAVSSPRVTCRVVQGGVLKSRKGMNLPAVDISVPSFTDKDRRDAAFAMELGVDYLAMSFVRRASDVDELRALMHAAGSTAPIIAKIEKPEALENIEAILDAFDAIMVARGDLGVELPPEMVPVAQDHLVELARSRRKPVIVATQMLESMVQNSRPTRAEVSDVSHAVSSGADAIMLSAETAVGRFPVRAVEIMDAVARKMEGHLFQDGAFASLSEHDTASPRPRGLRDAVARATAGLSRDLLVRSIFVLSLRGQTAVIMSSFRPAAPLIVVTPNAETCRQLMLVWGVVPIVATPEELADPQALARRTARQLDLASEGQHVMLVQGFQKDPAQDAPMISIVTV